ncbi:MAG: thiamine pyrophosphate-dependent dehydrogenase E1 component subunit alpha [Planctomycetes bacterium]|nr:thiamine pyrophosphate-dependent dehydrogenase E1 component subunit alpha [Planctomycetota bacterium]
MDQRVEASAAAPSKLSRAAQLEMHLFLRLAREWDLRFETMYRSGALAKWYSSVGNEGFTVPAATALEAGDALLTLHRDSGAILRTYLDPEALFPGLLTEPGFPDRKRPSVDSHDLLYRLSCQMLGKRDGFSNGIERSYHYGHIDEPNGLIHIGMISHLGAMIPVATGAALALKQRGTDRVAINFIGDGATSTGDFHEALNIASVMKLPFILVIENNQYAFSTPAHQQFACDRLADRAAGYGMPGYQLDGNDPEVMFDAFTEAVARARRGDGPTLIEAMVGRLRGHSQGDDSFKQVPPELVERYQREEPLVTYEARLLERGVCDQAYLDEVAARTKEVLIEIIDRAVACPDPDPSQHRPVYAEDLR